MPTAQTVEWVGGSHEVEYAYDAGGLLSQAGELTVTERSAGNGLLLWTELGSVSVAYGHSHAGELQSVVAKFGAADVFREEVELDSLGRIDSLTVSGLADSVHSIGYEYSATGRLVKVWRDGLLVGRYGYDPNGNRDTTWLPSGAMVLAATDEQDRLTFAGTDTFAYTPAGELAMRYSGPDTTRYTYDPLGNLLEVRLPRGGVVTYIIDGMNRRVGRRVDGVLDRQWLYQNSRNPVAELDGDGSLLARYVYGTRSHVPDYVRKADSTYRIVTDHLGSVRRVVNVENGFVAMKLEHDAWGEVTASQGTGFVWLGFAGGITDDSTSLVRFGARDYDPHVGRWTTKDPVGFTAGANAYAYAEGSPVTMVDPSGAAAEWPGGGLGPEATITNNVCVGRQIGASFGGGLGGEVERAQYFYDLVTRDGPFDFRSLGRYRDLIGADQAAIGNRNYGALGTAIGYTPTTLLIAGGWSCPVSVDG